MKQLFLSLIAFCTVAILYAQPPAGAANVGDMYGENVTAKGAIKGKKLTAQLKKTGEEKIDAKVEGTVVEVCANKGCWAKVKLDDQSTAMVKMKGYAFFVPTALEGKRVVIDGKAEMTTTSVNDLKHIAEDAKKPQAEIDAITEPKQEIKILANGITVIK